MMQEMRQEQTMSMKLGARLDVLLWRKDFEFCEILSGLAALGWGIILAMPWSTFSTSPAFALLSYIPELIVALIMIVLGVTQLASLFFEVYRLRRMSCIIASGVWAAISVNFALGNPYGLAIVVYPLFAVMSAWAYLRIKRIAVYE